MERQSYIEKYGKERRPRLRHVHLATISVALDHYIKFLEEELTRHEDDPARFEEEDKWLQKREELNWLLTRARSARHRIAWNLKGLPGRTPEPLKDLLAMKAESRPGEYIPFYEGMKMMPYQDFVKDSSALFTACEKNVIESFRDPVEDGLLKVRKVDVQRYVAWLEAKK